MAEIDRVWVKDLEKEFGIGKTALYARFSALGIVPTKDGKRSYVSGEQFTELLRLDEILRRGGRLPVRQVNPVSDVSGELSVNESPETPIVVQLNADLHLLQAIADAIHPPKPVADYFEALDYLERAAIKKRILPSWLVRELTGSTPKGEIWKWNGGFEFVRVSRGWWRVKPAKAADLGEG